GWIDSFNYPYGASFTGAPPQLDKYKMFFDAQNDSVNDFPPQYAYFGPDFKEPTDHWNPLAAIRPSGPLWGQNLTWNFTYGTFATGNGGFTPDVTVNTQRVANFARINTSTGSYGLVDGSVSVPAAAYKNNTSANLLFAVSHTGEGTF